MRKHLLLLSALLAGCSTVPMPAPMPAPMPESKRSCDMTVDGECRTMSASEKGGAVVRGHEEKPKEPL